MTSTRRIAAAPSHNGGVCPSGHCPERISDTPRRMAAGSSLTRRLVPIVVVAGRSVFPRRVRQGTFRTVVSSWIPPESVSTKRALAMRPRNDRYGNGSHIVMPGARRIFTARIRSRVRGCTGNKMGVSWEISLSTVNKFARFSPGQHWRDGAGSKGHNPEPHNRTDARGTFR